MNYTQLTTAPYVDLVLDLISSAEGHEPTVRDIGDRKATIGYGYTFGRSNNLALWQAAGITLTSADIALLQAIDAAPPAQREAMALRQFTRSLEDQRHGVQTRGWHYRLSGGGTPGRLRPH